MASRLIKAFLGLLLLLLAGLAVGTVGTLVFTGGAIDPLGLYASVPLPVPTPIGPPAVPGTINVPAEQIHGPAPLNSVVPKRPLFKNIPLPQEISPRAEVIATDLFLALLLVVALGSVTAVLNNLNRRHEATFRRLRPRWLVREYRHTVRRGCLGLPIILIIFAFYGIIFAFLEAGTAITSPAGIQLALVLAVSVGLVSLGGDFARRWVARLWPGRANFGLYPANLIVAVVTTLFSRGAFLSPGILYGVPGGADITLEEEKRHTRERVLALVTLVSVSVIGVLGWVMSGALVEAGKTTLNTASLVYLGPIVQLFETLGLAIFAVAVQTAFFEMLPLTASTGARLFRWNPVIWALLMLPVTFVFAFTVLNPAGDFFAAFSTPNVQVTVVLLDVLVTATLVLWLYFALIAPFFAPRQIVEQGGVPWYMPPAQNPPPRPVERPAWMVETVVPPVKPTTETPSWMLDTDGPFEYVEEDTGDTRPNQRPVIPYSDTQPVRREPPVSYEGLFPPAQPGDEDYLESLDNQPTPNATALSIIPPAADTPEPPAAAEPPVDPPSPATPPDNVPE